MRNRLIALRDYLRSTYWFIPLLMAVASVVLSMIALSVDQRIGPQLTDQLGIVAFNTPEGARAMLTTIASAMLTVAGTVFSLTMVVLSLSSQQYGPLSLENFMRDHGNQFVLGVFTSTFIYCLLVLRAIRVTTANVPYVPAVSSLIAVGMALVSVFMLIYFIHHISEKTQAQNIVNGIGGKLLSRMPDLFPQQMGHMPDDMSKVRLKQVMPQDFDARAVAIHSRTFGYLQLIDGEALIAVLKKHELVLKLLHRPGDYLLEGTVTGYVWPGERLTDDIDRAIQETLLLGKTRTQSQDIDYLFNQLTSIAVRALSPGINDPFTAMMVVNQLADALCILVKHDTPSGLRFDGEDQLRVIAHPLDLDALLGLAFDQIRRYGRDNPIFITHLLEMLGQLAHCAARYEHRDTLRQYADTIVEESLTLARTERDREAIEAAYQQLLH